MDDCSRCNTRVCHVGTHRAEEKEEPRQSFPLDLVCLAVCLSLAVAMLLRPTSTLERMDSESQPDFSSRVNGVRSSRGRDEVNGAVVVDPDLQDVACVLFRQDVLLVARRGGIVEHRIAEGFRRDARHRRARRELRLQDLSGRERGADQGRRGVLEEVEEGPEVLRVREPLAHRIVPDRVLVVVAEDAPPVAARGQEACVVGDFEEGRPLAGLQEVPDVLLVVQIAVFVGEADAADAVWSVVDYLDKGVAPVNAEGEGDEGAQVDEGLDGLGGLHFDGRLGCGDVGAFKDDLRTCDFWFWGKLQSLSEIEGVYICPQFESMSRCLSRPSAACNPSESPSARKVVMSDGSAKNR